MTGWALLAAVLLVVANGFFVAVEFALIAARRTRIEPLASQGNRRARLSLDAMQELSLQLAGAQLGITMASLGLGFVAEPAVASVLGRAIEAVVDLPEQAVHSISFVVALSIVVFVHMVLGEMVPKNIAIAGAERTLMALALPNRVYVSLFRPVIRALNGVANLGVRSLGIEPPDELAHGHTREELSAMLTESRSEGFIVPFEEELLRGALHFGNRTTGSVMVPIDRVVTVARVSTARQLEQVVVASGHSRLPVRTGGGDGLVGFVHAKDLLGVPAEALDRPIDVDLIRRMLVVPPERSLEDLLLAMRLARVHVAVVVDAGRTVGLVTLEDLLEQLVGDIRDESDQEDQAGPADET